MYLNAGLVDNLKSSDDLRFALNDSVDYFRGYLRDCFCWSSLESCFSFLPPEMLLWTLPLMIIPMSFHQWLTTERPNCQSSKIWEKKNSSGTLKLLYRLLSMPLMFSCRMFGSMTDIVGQIQYFDFVYRTTIKQKASILSALSCHIQSKQVFNCFVYHSQYYICMSVCLLYLFVSYQWYRPRFDLYSLHYYLFVKSL